MKKLICTMSAILFGVSLTVSEVREELANAAMLAANEAYVGDVNRDGNVDSTDASVILEEYSNLSTGGNPMYLKMLADFNEDGSVDSSDASAILRFYSSVSTGAQIGLKVIVLNNEVPTQAVIIPPTTQMVTTSEAITTTTAVPTATPTTSKAVVTTTAAPTTTKVPVTTVTPEPALGKRVTFNGKSWCLYTGKDNESSLVQGKPYLYNGDRFSVINQDGCWYTVKVDGYSDSANVYILPEDFKRYFEYLTGNETPASTTTPVVVTEAPTTQAPTTVTPAVGEKVEFLADSWCIYTGKDDKKLLLSEKPWLHQGDRFYIVAKDGYWYQIDVGYIGVAYVYITPSNFERYFKLLDGSDESASQVPTPTPTEEPIMEKRAIFIEDSWCLYTEKDYESQLFQEKNWLHGGDCFTIINQDQGWYTVKVDGCTGTAYLFAYDWDFARYFKYLDGTEITVQPADQGIFPRWACLRYKALEGKPMYQEKDPKSLMVDLLVRGDAVFVNSYERDGWYSVMCISDQERYYLKINDETEFRNTGYKPRKLTGGDTYLRVSKNENSMDNVFCKINDNSIIAIIGDCGDGWLGVLFGNYMGYIHVADGRLQPVE